MKYSFEKWAKQSVRNEQVASFDPVAPASVMQDLENLKYLNWLTWAERERAIRDSGVPYNMPEGTYGGLIAYPPAQTTTTTTINGTVNLWPNLIYTPIPQNSVMAPQVYRIAVCAKITTSTSPGNIGFAPAINSAGTWTTGGTAVSGGQALGASGNVALTASITGAFYTMIGDLTIRNGGTSSVIVGMFHYVSTQGTSGGLAGPAAVGTGHNLMFGGTNATVDTQLGGTQSFQLGGVHTVTTITHNIEQIHWMDWN